MEEELRSRKDPTYPGQSSMLVAGQLWKLVDSLPGFLSLQPRLHCVLGEKPPAPYTNTPGQVLSAGELVADSPRLKAERVGELLNGV
jgi:hypothetical protein